MTNPTKATFNRWLAEKFFRLIGWYQSEHFGFVSHFKLWSKPDYEGIKGMRPPYFMARDKGGSCKRCGQPIQFTALLNNTYRIYQYRVFFDDCAPEHTGVYLEWDANGLCVYCAKVKEHING
ncbi:MAG: hypothetical protein ACE5HI_15635 [bacterium]